MKRIATVNLAMALMLAGFFCWRNAPAAWALSQTNASAEVVIGQADMSGHMPNQGQASPDANTTAWSNGTWTDGKKLIMADILNNRVLIYNTIPTTNNASADVVIGQENMTSNEENQGGSAAANTLAKPYTVSSDGVRLVVADTGNGRVLIYNSIPTSNNASADIVIGQADMSGSNDDRGGSVDGNTLDFPMGAFTDGTRIFIVDSHNNRILIYNAFPTVNGASADIVVGQADMVSEADNRGELSAASNTLYMPSGVFAYDGKMYVTDAFNNRVLVFNSIPTANNFGADFAIGQSDITGNSANRGGDPAANTLNAPFYAFTDGGRLYISDYGNNRVLIFNSLPTSFGASADTVIGQADFSGNSPNQGQGGVAGANTLLEPGALFYGAGRLFVSDIENYRTLIYSLDAPYTMRNKSSQRLSGSLTAKLKKTTLTLSGRKTGLGRKGKVRIFQDGVQKTVRKVKRNGKWSAKIKQRQMNMNRLFQLRYYDSSGTIVEFSDQYNIYFYRSARNTRATVSPQFFAPTEKKSNKGGKINKNFFGI